jgi:hypothetical protein
VVWIVGYPDDIAFGVAEYPLDAEYGTCCPSTPDKLARRTMLNKAINSRNFFIFFCPPNLFLIIHFMAFGRDPK